MYDRRGGPVGQVSKVSFAGYKESVTEALDLIGVSGRLPDDKLITLKPNLTNASKPPVTTPVEIVEAVYSYCRDRCRADIAIGEGCGEGRTADTFRVNGYQTLARKYGIELIDFNHSDTVQLSNPDAHALEGFHMPAIVQDAFVISIPHPKGSLPPKRSDSVRASVRHT